LIACAPLAAKADDPPPAEIQSPAVAGATDESRAEARHYIAMRHVDQSAMAALLSQRPAFVDGLVKGYKFSSEAAESYVDHYVMPEYRLDIDDYVNLYVEAIASRFTAEEIRQLEAFLSTPVGAKFLSVQDRVTIDLTAGRLAWEKRVWAGAHDKFEQDKASAAKKPVDDN
jgi:hypothetical protein